MRSQPDMVPVSIFSCAGPCVWHVVGLQRSVREWALRQGWGRRSARQGEEILVAALEVLVYGTATGQQRRC
jgi:hypothetical protein